MKRSKLLLIMMTILALLSPGTQMCQAQSWNRSGAGRGPYRATHHNRQDYYHFAYVNASLGYTSLEEGIKHITPTGGLGNGFGIGYEFRYHNMWLSIGGQMSWHRSRSIIDNYQVNQEMTFVDAAYSIKDNTISNIDAIGTYTIKQTDKMNVAFVDVPFMMGYYYMGFYAGAGAKVGFGINSKVQAEGNYNLLAKSDKYIDPIDLGNYDFATEQSIRFAPLVSVIGEIGYDVLSNIETRSPFCHVLKVGFYFEVGCNSMVRPVTNGVQMTIDGETVHNGQDATHVAFNPYYTSAMKSKDHVAPFFTGIKITYMFGGSKTSNHGVAHRGCQCYEN